MGGVALSLLAMAAWASAAAVNQDQTGGQEWGLGMKLLEAGLEMATNESGVFGDFRGARGTGSGRFHIG